MLRVLCILLVLVSAQSLAQDDAVDSGKNQRYLKIDSSSDDAVIVDGTDIFESSPLGRLITNQKVTLTGEEDGEYVKIKAVIKGKTVEGWIKKKALSKKPVQNIPRVSESGSVPNGSMAQPASFDNIKNLGNPWENIDLTGKQAKDISGGIPLWIPIAGGTVLVGAGILLIKDDDESNSPAPVIPADNCDAVFTIATTPAICQIPLGNASIQNISDADISISWSNGQTADSISNLPPGNIYAIITYNEGQCRDSINTTISNASHDFSLTATPLKPGCTSIGDLQVSHTSFSGLSSTLTLEGPSGNISIPNPLESILLSDYTTPQAGNHFISIAFDATDECSMSVDADLQIIPLPELTVADIIPPSGPGMSDGAIFLQINVELPPWTLYVNGEALQTSDKPFFPLEGMSEGTYEIEIADARGCLTPPQLVELITCGRPPQRQKFGFQFMIKPLITGPSGN